MAKIYRDQDADLSVLKDMTIGIIGYGIQGRAQSFNLRDSGLNVIIGNRSDSFQDNVEKEGFKLYSFEALAEKSDIIMMLIPDDAQQSVYDNHLIDYMTDGKTLCFAHGFSLRYKRIIPPPNVDVIMLAPRMPGKQIRERFLANSGSPVFVGVYQNYSGNALQKVLALAKGIGATRVGALEVSIEEETEVDFFIEHFLIPIIIRAIRLSFDFLVEEGYSKEVSLLETFASGEIGELILEAATVGLYEVFIKRTSPTAQFGNAHYAEMVLPEKETKKILKRIISEIRDGTFAEILKEEGGCDYPKLNEYIEKNKQSLITSTHQKVKDLFNNNSDELQ